MNPHDVQIHCCAVLGCVSVSFIGGSVPAVEEIGRDDLDSSGEQYNTGPETTPRQAASVILLRGAGDGLELLLVKRNPAARSRGAIIRPLGDVVVVMPPLSIEADELEELIEIVADSIAVVTEMVELAAAA